MGPVITELGVAVGGAGVPAPFDDLSGGGIGRQVSQIFGHGFHVGNFEKIAGVGVTLEAGVGVEGLVIGFESFQPANVFFYPFSGVDTKIFFQNQMGAAVGGPVVLQSVI